VLAENIGLKYKFWGSLIMLTIKNLVVSTPENKIIKGINLELKPTEIMTVFGPNGSGKSTLLKAIAGIPNYTVRGEITFNGKEILKLPIEKRAKLGIVLGFQQPTEIIGIKLRKLLEICAGHQEFTEDELHLIAKLKMIDFLDRDINVHFSGGEKKRAEILQILFMKPKVLLLDEPDSGVDIESLKIIASEIRDYISRTGAAAILVTHQGIILNYIKSDRGCVLVEGKFACHEEPKKIFELISKNGYGACIKCEHSEHGKKN
jgi:Fe-S cluster assembly ATP-binding protein